MWTQVYELYLCLSLFKLQLILYRLRKEFTIYQESIQEYFETVISSNSEVDHWPTETTGITTFVWRWRMWRETILLTDRAAQFATGKLYVFSDSVLQLGGISTEPVKAKLNVLYFKDLDRIDGHQIEFEWKICQHSLHWEVSSSYRRQWFLNESVKLSTEHFKRGIIFMSMYNDIDWEKQRILYFECSRSYWVCSKIHARTVVISWVWIGEEMKWSPCQ